MRTLKIPQIVASQVGCGSSGAAGASSTGCTYSIGTTTQTSFEICYFLERRSRRFGIWSLIV